MAKAFSEAEWRRIHERLDGREAEYGLPERRRDSVVLTSFNIRKLGGKPRTAGAWWLLQLLGERSDLLAVQEIQDDLSGINHLKTLLGERYGLAASDITGSYPGQRPAPERLGFLFRWDRIQRTEIASDITYDRSKMIETLYAMRVELTERFDIYSEKLDDWRNGERKSKPRIRLPDFLTFIRQPHCVSFRIPGHGRAEPYEFMAINAHLLFGTKRERQWEFEALIAWLIDRAKQVERIYHKNFILLGDLNLDFHEVDRRRDRVERFIKSLNRGPLADTRTTINFPFMTVHPERLHLPEAQQIFRTNARLDQTYDHIALLNHDPRLPSPDANDVAGKHGPDGFDYGVFNFVQLFLDALELGPLESLDPEVEKHFFRRFEHDVSDHMPLWIRLPLPREA